MESRVKLLGHPVHQMLIVFPLGLLATALLFDLIHLGGDRPSMAFVSYSLISVGCWPHPSAPSTGWPFRRARGPSASG